MAVVSVGGEQIRPRTYLLLDSEPVVPRGGRTYAGLVSTGFHALLLGALLISQFSPQPPEDTASGGSTFIDVMAVLVLPPAPRPSPPPAVTETPKPVQQARSELPPLAPSAAPPIFEAALPVPEAGVSSLPATATAPLDPIAEPAPVARDTVAAPEAPATAAPVEGNAPVAGNAKPTWEGMVLAALERQKQYPAFARRRREQDIVYVQMSLDREGRVLSARIHKSRHYGELDAAALDLVRKASPLPKPPADLPGDRIDLIVPIEYFLSRGR
jgi:periplasmic protein TonB